MPVGKQRSGSIASEPALTPPPIKGTLIQIQIPLEMIEAALVRHAQRPTPLKVAKAKQKKPRVRFSIPLARIEMPLDPIPRKK
jgi:hypothetical protein